MEESWLPSDVVSRARLILDHCPGNSVGSIMFKGVSIIRQHVAQYISERDGVQANMNDVFICSGVFHGATVRTLSGHLNLIETLDNDTSSSVEEALVEMLLYLFFFPPQILYYLDENNGWAHSISRMQRSLDASRKFCEPRFLFVVNPGNPTGITGHLSKSLSEIASINFTNQFVIFCREFFVFEHNIYTEHAPFHSFRKVMHKMGDPWSKTQLITFNSLSKGIMAEDGLQCGYFEIVNLNGDDKKRLLKAVVELLPSTLSQVALDCLVKPPQLGDPSYDLYLKEKNTILESLKNRAELVQNTLNSIEGFYCSPIQGAMCAFPRVLLPQKAIDKAKSLGQEPSYFYASQLLEKKGVCVTPGSAFGQLPGTCHFRVTILPPMARLLDMLGRIKDFHEELTNQYK
ncbi:alanine aminotransferase, putative [Ixodes scapularis]|uniref:alanine transaminase n=1 Tax=Ixodes scapularis TaxID=6945 RepID=B7PAY5_IXOSC|nr:alanine aminotransferase, putative [Ixodes scapularis]|eukprot:XP_002407443.1 alanine aminotransferase, putative [Ixodes scapularis]